MTILPSNRDYTDKDFEAIRARTFSLIQSVFPKWSNLAVSNFGNILVESFGWILDVLTFYQDQHAREGRWGLAVLRRSMINLAKLINYQIPGAAAATADVVVTILNPDVLTGTIVAVTGVPVVVKTEDAVDPIRGELISPLPFQITVTAGSKTFVWEHLLTQPRHTVASTGLADQKIPLPFVPFLDDDSEVVQTASQGVFTRVDTFYNSGPTDTHYRIAVDQGDRAEVIFGDGTNGVFPVGNINIDYRTGGGAFGNVEQETLKKLEGNFVDSVGTAAYLSASNAVAAEGGLPREEVEATRINAPESIRVLTRTVAREDYEINAEKVAGIGRSLMLTSNEDVVIDENTGNLYIVPSTGGIPSQGLLDAAEYNCTVEYPNTITFQLFIKPVSYLTINVQAVVFLVDGAVPSTVKTAVTTNLEDFFVPMLASGAKNPNVDFGWNYKDVEGNPAGEIAFSDVHNVVRDTAGVRKVGSGLADFTLNGVHSDAAIPNWQFPKLGTIMLINGDTGTAI